MSNLFRNLFAPRSHAFFSYSTAALGAADAEIRMLELLPAAPTEELACRLMVVKIAQLPQDYKGLSYAWGNGDSSHTITVLPAKGSGGTPGTLRITESLHTGLVHLRDAHQPVRLWVDQICINQEDLVEKGQQVSLMGSIYSKAEQVLVWLGPAAHGSDALMDAWKSVGQAARDFGMESYYTKDGLPLLNRMLNNSDSLDPKTTEFRTLLRDGAEVFAPLITGRVLQRWFSRPWFERAWTVQEFCLCANTVFICGTKIAQAELVMLAIQILRYSIGQLMETFYLPASVPSNLLNEISQEPTSDLFSCRQKYRKFARREPNAIGDRLYDLMHKLYVDHNTQTTLHRDRVLSVLSLAVDASSLRITPDYTNQSLVGDARILTVAARAMITNHLTGRIEVLCSSQFPKHPSLADLLPSWVPDWRGNLRPSYYRIHEAVDTHIFSACGSDPSEVKPLSTADPSILGLAGYLVDTISTTAPGEAWNDMSWVAARLRSFLTQVDTLFDLATSIHRTLPSLYATEERRAEARWRVPVGDMYWTPADGMRRATPETAVRHTQAAETLAFFDETAQLDVAEQDRKFSEWDWDGRQTRGELGSFYVESMRYMKGKRPFLTAGGYLGMGPAEARDGDVVVVFCGGRIPFVLRPVMGTGGGQGGEELFRYVGEAYCDGVMDGEIVSKRQLTKFYLL